MNEQNKAILIGVPKVELVKQQMKAIIDNAVNEAKNLDDFKTICKQSDLAVISNRRTIGHSKNGHRIFRPAFSYRWLSQYRTQSGKNKGKRKIFVFRDYYKNSNTGHITGLGINYIPENIKKHIKNHRPKAVQDMLTKLIISRLAKSNSNFAEAVKVITNEHKSNKNESMSIPVDIFSVLGDWSYVATIKMYNVQRNFLKAMIRLGYARTQKDALNSIINDFYNHLNDKDKQKIKSVMKIINRNDKAHFEKKG